MEQKMKRYDIIEKYDADDISIWSVSLPENIFEMFINEGINTRGSVDQILHEIKEDTYFSQNSEEELLQWFRMNYESPWDWLHLVAQCGQMLQFFINEKRPDHAWMFWHKPPIHISDVPEAIREEYVQYLKDYIVEQYDSLDGFTELHAAQQAWESEHY